MPFLSFPSLPLFEAVGNCIRCSICSIPLVFLFNFFRLCSQTVIGKILLFHIPIYSLCSREELSRAIFTEAISCHFCRTVISSVHLWLLGLLKCLNNMLSHRNLLWVCSVCFPLYCYADLIISPFFQSLTKLCLLA